MDLMEVSRRDKFRALFVALGIALVAVLIAPPVVEAATQNVRVKGKVTVKGGPVKTKASNGNVISSDAIADMGITDVPGTNGAVSVKTFAGGQGVLGLGDCAADAQHPLPETVTIPGQHVISALIITGDDGAVTLTSEAIGAGQVPLSIFKVSANNPNETLALGNGLGVTAPLTFAGSGTDCRFVILGQGEGVVPGS
ncbi:MAG TPA: hypothetical protein VFS18_03325 [Actinomycetota bacterium]|nr:hypothetical protein [Actinomycetota bacterium]